MVPGFWSRDGTLLRKAFDFPDHFCESSGGTPNAKPPVTEPSRALDGGIGSATDDDGDRWVGSWANQRFFECKEFTGMTGRRSAKKAVEGHECFIRPSPARCRINAADFDFMTVLAANTDPENEPSGRGFAEGGELTCDRERMSEG